MRVNKRDISPSFSAFPSLHSIYYSSYRRIFLQANKKKQNNNLSSVLREQSDQSRT